MRRSFLMTAFALTAALASGCGRTGTTKGARVSASDLLPDVVPGAAYPMWEHACVEVDSYRGVAALFSEASQKGWEMISLGGANASVVCFKRPLPTEAGKH